MSATSSTAMPLPRLMALPLPEDATSESATQRVADEKLRALTAAVRHGDERAFNEFYAAHSLRLYKYLLALARGDETLAREAAQAVALKLARRMEIFDSEERLWAWLRRLARNAFIDQYRARVRDQQRMPLEELLPSAAPADKVDPLAAALACALAECDPVERELLQSFHVDGRPLGELAAAAGLSSKALESRLARLRQKVRARLLRHLRHET